MNLTAEQIDAIVRSVLERISQELRTPQTQASSSPAADEYRHNQRVLGMHELRDLPQSVRRIVVRRGTVITPAVRDLLKERNQTLVWAVEQSQANLSKALQSAEQSPTNRPRTNMIAVRELLLGHAAARGDVPGLTRQLAEHGWLVQELARSGLETVAAELALAATRDGKRGVLLTDQPWQAVIAVNRVAGARGAWVRDRRETQTAMRAVRPNVAIVDLTGQNRYGVWNTLQPFLTTS